MLKSARISVSFSFIALIFLFNNCSVNGFEGASRYDSLSHSSGLDYFGISSRSLDQMTSVDERVEVLKYRSCMFNSLIYPETASYRSNLQVLKRSSCLFLPRVVETWNRPPDFSAVKAKIRELEEVTGRQFIYGIFLAESISTTAKYADESGQAFDFQAMCAPGSMGEWGDKTCVPTTESKEYMRYLRDVVKRSLDAGISDFLFGQTGYLDTTYQLADFVKEMRQMAAQRGVTITIGQQPNGIQPEAYLKAFDYVISPLYVGEDRSKPCLSRFDNYCQAVYTHPELARQARTVIAEIDWSSSDDDVHRLGQMSQPERHRFMFDRAEELRSRGLGIILPFDIPYNSGSNQECRGINQWVYSANDSYQCRDEEAWNMILQGKKPQTIVSTSPTPPSTPQPRPTPVPTPVKDVIDDRPTSLTLAQAQQRVIKAYITVLGRTANEARGDIEGISYWSGRLLSGLSESVMVAEMRASDEHFIRHTYLSVLGRRVDNEGLEYYGRALRSGSKTRDQIKQDLVYVCQNQIGGECL